MKKILTNIIFIVLLHSSGFCQKFNESKALVESKEFQLTEVDSEELNRRRSENGLYHGNMPIFIKNKKGEILTEIKVYGETYGNDAIIEEVENIHFTNVKKIIRLEIFQCACYCESSLYYWLLTEQNKWFPLRVLEQGVYDFKLNYRDYEFSKTAPYTIQLKEYQDERIDKNLNTSENIRRKSEKVIISLVWDGKTLKE